MENWHLANGYRYAGIHCGVRPDPERRDLTLIVSEHPASAAGVFTQNRVVAAPVRVCKERLPSRDARGIVICSGNANACTGRQGMTDARRMAELAAQSVGCRSEQFLVASTGVIGRFLPMARLETGIPRAVKELGASGAALVRAAQAILTTDTIIKVATRGFPFAGRDVQVTGLAKGAAMIGPNMATLLAFVMTDAAVTPDDLARLAARAAEQSFNSISVEGHTSTNDTLIFLANGQGPPLAGADLTHFEAEAIAVCVDLSRAIVADAEGASHLVTIEVEGLRDDAEARRVAKTVAESALVKTAIYGADPNWGRIISAAGYAGVEFAEEQLSLWLGDLPLYQAGVPLPFDAAAASNYLKTNRAIEMRLRFTIGAGRATFWTCDLTPEYVRLNADYTT